MFSSADWDQPLCKLIDISFSLIQSMSEHLKPDIDCCMDEWSKTKTNTNKTPKPPMFICTHTCHVLHQTPKSRHLSLCILFNHCMLTSSLVKKDIHPLRAVQPTQHLSHPAEVPVSHDGLQMDPSEIRLPNRCLEETEFSSGFRTVTEISPLDLTFLLST